MAVNKCFVLIAGLVLQVNGLYNKSDCVGNFLHTMIDQFCDAQPDKGAYYILGCCKMGSLKIQTRIAFTIPFRLLMQVSFIFRLAKRWMFGTDIWMKTKRATLSARKCPALYFSRFGASVAASSKCAPSIDLLSVLPVLKSAKNCTGRKHLVPRKRGPRQSNTISMRYG